MVSMVDRTLEYESFDHWRKLCRFVFQESSNCRGEAGRSLESVDQHRFFVFRSRSWDTQWKYWPARPDSNGWWESWIRARWICRFNEQFLFVDEEENQMNEIKHHILYFHPESKRTHQISHPIWSRGIVCFSPDENSTDHLNVYKNRTIIEMKGTSIIHFVVSSRVFNPHCHGFRINSTENFLLGPITFLDNWFVSWEISWTVDSKQINKQVTFDLDGNQRFLTRSRVLRRMHVDSTNRSQISKVGKSRSDLLA